MSYEELQRVVLTRRALLRSGVLGGVGLATAAVIGCDDDDDGGGGSASGGAASTPRTTGSFVYGDASRSTPNLDPNSTVNTGGVYNAVFEQLVRLDENAGLQPGLAESWELDPNDPKRWVYNLREAEWSDGVAFTAEAHDGDLARCQSP